MKEFDIVVLAAGNSSRMGRSKTEIVIDGKAIIEHTILQAYELCRNVIVVGGKFYKTQKEILKPYKKVNFVYNPNFSKGMFSSVKAGIREVSSECFFLIPGDIPFVRKETYLKLQEINGEIIIPTFKNRKGHPVFFSSDLVSEIERENTESNLRDFIKKKAPLLIDVDDEYILKDIDIPKDLENIK